MSQKKKNFYDYFVNIAERLETELNHYNHELSKLQHSLREAKQEEGKEIRRQIEQVKQNLRTKWKDEAADDPSRVLATQIADDATVWWLKGLPLKEDARVEIYLPIASEVAIKEPGKIADNIDFRPDFSQLSSTTWLAFQVNFELLTPWYSKDDRVFHVLDNPVRKDRVFGVPFMAASSWKGMLRWSFRVCTKLVGPEKESDEEKRKQAQAWELHLFGNEKGEEDNFHQGALVFYPTWFDKIGFEVINPHSRERRAGTQPIYYEVVPPGAKGTLSLLYAPWPGMKPAAKPEEVLPKLLEAIETLLITYGISAKRTVGWGTAKITEWRAFHKTHGSSTQKQSRNDLWQDIQSWLS